MQDGIKLLIDRMDSYPEEFFGELSFRWSEIMQDIAKHGPEFLDEEDLLMLNKKVKEVRRKELNAKIVEEIATGARLQVANERHSKTNERMRLDSSGNLGIGSAIIKPQGQKVWWSGEVSSNNVNGYDPNSESFFGRSILDMIERGRDNAVIQNIRAQNAMLQEQLAETQAEIAKRDEARKQSQAYKKRNNQNWK
jgi:hypothetical protein